MQEIEVDITAIVEVWQVGAHFKALSNVIFVVPSIFRCLFFTSQTRPPEHCVQVIASKRALIDVSAG